MKLADRPVGAFVELLGSGVPAPGGGSAAALQGALGAALAHMVSALTVGKKKYEAHWPVLEEILAAMQPINSELLSLIDRDTEAYNMVGAALALPKETEAEKAARKDALQAALRACTQTPFETMCACLAALELAEKALGRYNVNAASDLGMAALSLKAAVQGAWLNVQINLGGIEDRALAEDYRAKAQAVLDKSLPIADKIYQSVLVELL